MLNPGNGGAAIFHQDGDDLAIFELLAAAKNQFLVNVFDVYLMPNYFHLYRAASNRSHAQEARKALKGLEKVACPLSSLQTGAADVYY